MVKGHHHSLCTELCQTADGDAFKHDDTHHVCGGSEQKAWGGPTDHLWEAGGDSKVLLVVEGLIYVCNQVPSTYFV